MVVVEAAVNDAIWNDHENGREIENDDVFVIDENDESGDTNQNENENESENENENEIEMENDPR